MAALTMTIEPDEFLGLSALVELEKAAHGGEADAASTAKTLMHAQLAAKLHELGLPWAPSQETVQRRVAEDAQPDGALRSLMRNNRVRKYAASVLAVAVLVALWGGYIRGWQWTGFPANNQLWNWFQLLLLPIAVAALGVWPSGRRSLRPYQKGVLAFAALGWAITIIGGYALRWNWTGYQGNTLWDWLGLLLLPLVVPTVLLPATVTWISGDAAQRAEEAREVPEQRSAVSHRAESRPAIPPRPPAGARTSLMLAGRSGPAIARRPTTGRGARPRRRAAAEDS
jgi:hypothetical protein